MKGGLYIGKTSLLMFLLTYCLLHSFPLTEARDLEDELINNRGKGLVTLSLKTRPSENITRHKKSLVGSCLESEN